MHLYGLTYGWIIAIGCMVILVVAVGLMFWSQQGRIAALEELVANLKKAGEADYHTLGRVAGELNRLREEMHAWFATTIDEETQGAISQLQEVVKELKNNAG